MVAGYTNLPGYTYAEPQPRIRKVVVRGELITIIDTTTTGSTDTFTCPGPYCMGTMSCNCNPWGASPAPVDELSRLLQDSAGRFLSNRWPGDDFPWEERLRDVIAMGAKFHEDFKILFRGGWIPHHGYGGIIPPVQELEPPLVTAAPAPDDRRRRIRAIYTVRPMRVP